MSFSISDLGSSSDAMPRSPKNHMPTSLKNGQKSPSFVSTSDLDNGQNIREKTAKVKAEINLLIDKASSYSKNTSIDLGSLTPTKSPRSGAYSRSPFGKGLGISDYSTLTVSPSAANSSSKTMIIGSPMPANASTPRSSRSSFARK